MGRQPAGHSEHGVGDGPELPGQLEPACVPSQVEPEQGPDVVDPGAGDAGRRTDRTRIGGEPVDVVTLEAGVGDGGQRSVGGEQEGVAAEPATDVGGPETRDERG